MSQSYSDILSYLNALYPNAPKGTDALDLITFRSEEVWTALFDVNDWERVVEDFCDELTEKLHIEMGLDYFEAISHYFPSEVREQTDDIKPVVIAIKEILDKYEAKYLTS